MSEFVRKCQDVSRRQRLCEGVTSLCSSANVDVVRQDSPEMRIPEDNETTINSSSSRYMSTVMGTTVATRSIVSHKLLTFRLFSWEPAL